MNRKEARETFLKAIEEINKQIDAAVATARAAGAAKHAIAEGLRRLRTEPLLTAEELAHKAKKQEERKHRFRVPPVSFDDVAKRQAQAEQYRARLYDEAQKREEERERLRKVNTEIIDAGYKALAVKHHPDKGGPQETMALLNVGRNHLKKFA